VTPLRLQTWVLWTLDGAAGAWLMFCFGWRVVVAWMLCSAANSARRKWESLGGGA